MSITVGATDEPSENASRPDRSRLHWRFMAPAVLVLLSDGPAHGYQLLSRLRPMFPADTGPPDASGLYRLLHRLEGDGSLRSSWTNSGPGPARRVYEVTDFGRATLNSWAPAIGNEIQALCELLAVYCRTTAGHGTPDGGFPEGNGSPEPGESTPA